MPGNLGPTPGLPLRPNLGYALGYILFGYTPIQ